jgi:hypothetical protein
MEAVDRPWMEEPQGYGGDDDHRYHTVNMYRVSVDFSVYGISYSSI